MSTDQRDMTGVWYGRYDGGGNAATSFIALIEEAGGALSGTISEPDDSGRSDVRRAYVSGERAGPVLRFVKQYDGAVFAHAVLYAGRVNEDGTEATGHWTIRSFTGSFVMTREKFDADEIEEEEEAELEVPLMLRD